MKKTKRRGKKDDIATCMEAYFLHNSLYILYTQTSQVPSECESVKPIFYDEMGVIWNRQTSNAYRRKDF